MTEETAGDKEDDAGCSTQSGVQEPELGRGHLFQKAADPADEIVRSEQVQIKDADYRGRQCSGRDARIERERHRKDVRKANAVEDVKGDEPADRNFSSGTRRNHCANRERDETGDGHEAADSDLRNFRWLRKLFRPESPEHHRAGEETYRHDRIERDQPCRRHLAAEKDGSALSCAQTRYALKICWLPMTAIVSTGKSAISATIAIFSRWVSGILAARSLFLTMGESGGSHFRPER